VTRGAMRRTGLAFWKHAAGAAFRELSCPCIRRGPQTHGDETPEKTHPVWARFCVFAPKIR
jgi:hypothetical protein